MNAWAASLLGNPAQVRSIVESLDPSTGEVLQSNEVRLDALGLAPLDFIYAVEGGTGGEQGEIEQRILYTITREPGGFPAGSLLRINPGRKPGWAPQRARTWRVHRVVANGAQTDYRRARD